MHEDVLEQKHHLREAGRVQQKDLFERLLALMATQVQTPLPALYHESLQRYHVLQSKKPLDNSVVGLSMRAGLNASWSGKMYSVQSSTPVQRHQVRTKCTRRGKEKRGAG